MLFRTQHVSEAVEKILFPAFKSSSAAIHGADEIIYSVGKGSYDDRTDKYLFLKTIETKKFNKRYDEMK